MTAVFEQAYVKKLNGPNVKKGTSKMDLAEQLMEDIKTFKETNGCDRLVAVWCGSTEVYRKPTDVHSSLAKFEAGLERVARRHRAVADLRVRVPQDGRARTPTARRTCRSTRPRCSSSRASRACRSPARTSRPARR